MFRKELSYYFSTPIAYIVIGLYWVGISLFLWVIPGEWNIIGSGYAQVDGLFHISPWLLILLCPALTMRLIAEERQTGTWDLLRTLPIPLHRVVLCKYAAAWTLTAIALLPCSVHYFLVYYIAEPIGNVDGGAFSGSMLGLLFLSAAFTSIGLLASSFTKSQIVSFILGAMSSFVLYWVTLQEHYLSMARGVLDLRDILLFLSITILSLSMSIFVLDRIDKK